MSHGAWGQRAAKHARSEAKLMPAPLCLQRRDHRQQRRLVRRCHRAVGTEDRQLWPLVMHRYDVGHKLDVPEARWIMSGEGRVVYRRGMTSRVRERESTFVMCSLVSVTMLLVYASSVRVVSIALAARDPTPVNFAQHRIEHQ